MRRYHVIGEDVKAWLVHRLCSSTKSEKMAMLMAIALLRFFADDNVAFKRAKARVSNKPFEELTGAGMRCLMVYEQLKRRLMRRCKSFEKMKDVNRDVDNGVWRNFDEKNVVIHGSSKKREYIIIASRKSIAANTWAVYSLAATTSTNIVNGFFENFYKEPTMQISKLLLSVFVAMNAVGGLYAGPSKTKVQKAHIQVMSLSQTNGGILVQTTAGPVLLKTLRCDERGMFFTKGDMVMVKGVKRHHEDLPMRRRCPYCDTIRYDGWEYWNHVDNCPENPMNERRR